MCHKDPSSAAGPPIVLYYHADTDWIFSKAILSAKYFQHLMLNHWVLIAEPTDKAFEGAWFANTNEDQIVFKNSGPTINSLHKCIYGASKETFMQTHRADITVQQPIETEHCFTQQCSWNAYRLWALSLDNQEWRLRLKKLHKPN